MTQSFFKLISRIMFMVMIVTFGSPAVSGSLISLHHESDSNSAHHQIAHHDQEGFLTEPEEHHHEDTDESDDLNPHSSIGHLLSHMPTGVFNTQLNLPESSSGSIHINLIVRSFTYSYKPPVPPPRKLLA